MYNLRAPVLHPAKPFFNRRFNFSFHCVNIVSRDSLLPLRFRIDESPLSRCIRMRRRCSCSRRRRNRRLKIGRTVSSRVDLGCSTSTVTLTVSDLDPSINGKCSLVRPEPVHFLYVGAPIESESCTIGWIWILKSLN